MYNLSAKNLEELNKDITNNERFVEEFIFMTELKVALTIEDILKNTDVVEFKIVQVKEEYNDEGLDVGVYCDISRPNVDFMYWQDADYEYSRNYRSRFNTKEYTKGSEEYKTAKIIGELNEALAPILFDDKLPFARGILEHLEGVCMTNNIDDIVKTVCGEEKLKEWKIRQERQSIDKTITRTATPSKTTKAKKI